MTDKKNREEVIFTDKSGNVVTDPKKAAQAEVTRTDSDGNVTHTIMVPSR